MGPLRQLKRMFEPTRLIATIVMLVSLFPAGWLAGWLVRVSAVGHGGAFCLSCKTVIIPTALPCLNTLCRVLGEWIMQN